MEGGYDHVDVTVHLYDGTTRPAIAYTFKPDRRKVMLKHNPPGERYIDIIVRGCEHYGVKKEWIDHLKTVEVTPRKSKSVCVECCCVGVFRGLSVVGCWRLRVRLGLV